MQQVVGTIRQRVRRGGLDADTEPVEAYHPLAVAKTSGHFRMVHPWINLPARETGLLLTG